jgi:hypothetical protein
MHGVYETDGAMGAWGFSFQGFNVRMAALCEAPLERQLKPLFRVGSAFVQDNGAVKNALYSTETLWLREAKVLSGTQPGAAQGLSAWGRVLRARGVACAVLTVCTVAWQGGAWASDKGDHERARQAVQSGQVMPLAKVLARIEREHPGQVLEVELESHDRQWQYEIKVLKPDGRLSKLKIDARTGEILKHKTR